MVKTSQVIQKNVSGQNFAEYTPHAENYEILSRMMYIRNTNNCESNATRVC